MPNYQNGKIYCIRSYQTDDIYIGSTTYDYLSTRFSIHRDKYKKYLNGTYHYVTSFQILQYPDAYIELIEMFACNSKDELTKREGYHIKNIDCVNRNIAGRTKAEYRRDNSDLLKQRSRQFRDENPDYNKQYYLINQQRLNHPNICCCGGRYTTTNKSNHLKSDKHVKYQDQHTLYLDVLFRLP